MTLIFILDSLWVRELNEQSLETALFGARPGGASFGEQANRADSRALQCILDFPNS